MNKINIILEQSGARILFKGKATDLLKKAVRAYGPIITPFKRRIKPELSKLVSFRSFSGSSRTNPGAKFANRLKIMRDRTEDWLSGQAEILSYLSRQSFGPISAKSRRILKKLIERHQRIINDYDEIIKAWQGESTRLNNSPSALKNTNAFKSRKRIVERQLTQARDLRGRVFQSQVELLNETRRISRNRTMLAALAFLGFSGGMWAALARTPVKSADAGQKPGEVASEDEIKTTLKIEDSEEVPDPTDGVPDPKYDESEEDPNLNQFKNTGLGSVKIFVDCPRFNRLAKDTLGKDVAAATGDIQKILSKLGYDLGSFGPGGDGIDNKCGKKTMNAVAAFQTQVLKVDPDADLGTTGPNQDGVDGVVGPLTWDIMTGVASGKSLKDAVKQAKDKGIKDEDSKEAETKGSETKKAASGTCSDVDNLSDSDAIRCAYKQRLYVPIQKAYRHTRLLMRGVLEDVYFSRRTLAAAERPEKEEIDWVLNQAADVKTGNRGQRPLIPTIVAGNDVDRTRKMASVLVRHLAEMEGTIWILPDLPKPQEDETPYEFNHERLLEEIAQAVRRFIRPALKKAAGSGNEKQKRKTVKNDTKKVDKKVDKKGQKKPKGIVAQLPMGELVGEPATVIVLPDGKKRSIQFNNDIKLTYDGGQYSFVFGPGGKLTASIKSASRQGDKIKVTLDPGAFLKNKTYLLSDNDLMSLLNQVTKPPMSKGKPRKVRIKGELGQVKKLNESKHYDLDFSRWEKMFK